MEAIGREEITPHSCRHTFIARAILSGMDLIAWNPLWAMWTKGVHPLKDKDLIAAVRKTGAVDYKLAAQKKTV